MSENILSKAKARFIRISPFKLRPLVSGIRGKNIEQAFNWLYSQPASKTVSVFKVLNSAWSNAKNLTSDELENEKSNVFVKIAKVDQGPVFKYFKPGSMGRSVVRRKRQSHIEVCLAKKIEKR